MSEKAINSTNIYLLSYNFGKRKLYYADSDTKGFNEYRFYDGEWIEDWLEGIVFYFTGKPGEDFLPGGLAWMLVSERVRQVFTQENIQGVQFLPVKAVLNESGDYLGPYWVINVMQNVESLKKGHAQNLDIFRVSTSTFISEHFKQILEKEEVTSGASFQRMPV